MSSEISKLTIGFALTGSYCTFDTIMDVLKDMVLTFHIVPIFSYQSYETDSRFGSAESFIKKVEEITGNKILHTIPEVEPIGPTGYLDALVIAPCTGNTLAKLCNGITDSPVLMAAKAHLRNEKPLIISLSTNDALGINFKNIGEIMNMKNIYLVPFSQDNYVKKPNSMISHTELIQETILSALKQKQLQPVIR